MVKELEHSDLSNPILHLLIIVFTSDVVRYHNTLQRVVVANGQYWTIKPMNTAIDRKIEVDDRKRENAACRI